MKNRVHQLLLALDEEELIELLTILSIPLSAFGGRSIIEYFEDKNDDSVQYIRATLHRMYQ